jgi:hypothetical protein
MTAITNMLYVAVIQSKHRLGPMPDCFVSFSATNHQFRVQAATLLGHNLDKEPITVIQSIHQV